MSLLLRLILFVVGFWAVVFSGMPEVLRPFVAAIINTLFDTVGFHDIATKKETLARGSSDFQRRVGLYRVIQVLWMAGLSVFLWLHYASHMGITPLASMQAFWSSIPESMIFLTLQCTGVCDIMYYIALLQNYFSFGNDMDWLNWTPFGYFSNRSLIKAIRVRSTLFITARVVTIQAIVAVIVCVLVSIFVV